jgi:hypothetical protein
VKLHFDSKIRKLLAPSGLFFNETLKVEDLILAGEKFVSTSARSRRTRATWA